MNGHPGTFLDRYFVKKIKLHSHHGIDPGGPTEVMVQEKMVAHHLSNQRTGTLLRLNHCMVTTRCEPTRGRPQRELSILNKQVERQFRALTSPIKFNFIEVDHLVFDSVDLNLNNLRTLPALEIQKVKVVVFDLPSGGATRLPNDLKGGIDVAGFAVHCPSTRPRLWLLSSDAKETLKTLFIQDVSPLRNNASVVFLVPYLDFCLTEADDA
ncbi:hypothetical protein DXG01_003153, partial [Tephrocybe rancida]